MTTSDRQKVILAVCQWAEAHPKPDTPTLQLFGSNQYSPRQIAKGLKTNTGIGPLMFKMLNQMAKKHSVDYVLEHMVFAAPAPTPVMTFKASGALKVAQSG